MFKSRYLGALLVSMLMLAACSENPLSPEHGSVTNGQNESALGKAAQALAILKDHGFVTENCIRESQHLILEQDMRFEIEDVLRLQDQAPNGMGKNPARQDEIQQWRHVFVVSQSRVSDIKVSLAANVPLAWKTAIRRAMAEWSRIPGSRIRFREVTYGQDMTIAVGYVSNPNFIAEATFPDYYGRSGPRVMINRNFLNKPDGEKVATMVHELGHTIGMRHINNVEPSRYHIPGTPLYDPYSIMHPNILGAWRGFSSGDIIAAQRLYPR